MLKNFIQEKICKYTSLFGYRDSEARKQNIIMYIGNKNNETEEDYDMIKKNINFMLDENKQRLMDTADRDVYLVSVNPFFITIVMKDDVYE
jgi:hypothetical protein